MIVSQIPNKKIKDRREKLTENVKLYQAADNPSNKKSHIANIKIIFTIWLFSVSLLYTFHAAMLLHNTNQECNKYFFSKICYFTQNYITV